jgi:hypothetical protein
MSNESLVLTFSLASEKSTFNDCIDVLRQEEYTGGYVTKSDIIEALEAQLFGSGTSDSIECNTTDDGGYETAVNVYPAGSDVGEVGLTNGTLGAPVLEEITTTEDVKFSLTTEQNTEFPIDTLISYEWGSDTWDSEGAVVTPSPDITVSNSTITVSEAVYGTVSITYKTLRYVRKATVSPIEDAYGNALETVAWAIKECGVEILVLSPPNNAQQDLVNGVNCYGGVGSSVDFVSSDDDSRPVADAKDQEVLIDYCTQKEVESYYA